MIEKKQIAEWLVAWFSQKGKTSVLQEAKRDENYFELGWIDSFGVIELIADIEKTFRIKFDAIHFQDRRFSTLNGLSNIIMEIMLCVKQSQKS